MWIVARVLAAGSPDGGFAGFRIKAGVIDLDSNAVVTPQAVRIQHGAVCRLTVDLDPPPAPPPTTGPGVDAAAANVALPATVAIEFAPRGAQVTALADFGATIYRTAVQCKKRAAAPAYQDRTREILIPGDAIPARCSRP